MSTQLLYEQQVIGDGRPRLVIADDDPFVRSMLQAQLQSTFDCVGRAADAEEAIEMVAAQRPDVVLLDVVMPGGGALAATREIRAASPETATVILSGDELHTDVIDLISAGATSYLRKGIQPHELASGLLAAVAAHRAAQGRAA